MESSKVLPSSPGLNTAWGEGSLNLKLSEGFFFFKKMLDFNLVLTGLFLRNFKLSAGSEKKQLPDQLVITVLECSSFISSVVPNSTQWWKMSIRTALYWFFWHTYKQYAWKIREVENLKKESKMEQKYEDYKSDNYWRNHTQISVLLQEGVHPGVLCFGVNIRDVHSFVLPTSNHTSFEASSVDQLFQYSWQWQKQYFGFLNFTESRQVF